jgi:glucose/mannose transport system permease protein
LLGASSAPSVRVRGQLGLGVDSSMMLATVVAVLVPLIYLESRSTRNAS